MSGSVQASGDIEPLHIPFIAPIGDDLEEFDRTCAILAAQEPVPFTRPAFIVVIAWRAFRMTANIPHMLKEQAEHISYIIKRGLDGNARVIEATKDAEDEWVGTINSLARLGERFYAECTPGYYNNEGRPGEGDGFLSGQYGAGASITRILPSSPRLMM